MFKSFITNIQRGVRSQRAQQQLEWTIFHTEVKHIHGTEVHHSNLIMSAHCNLIASAYLLEDGRFATYVDDDFFALPEDVQQFILAHEQGHAVHNHQEDSAARFKAAKKGEVYVNEHEADLHAVEQVGLDKAVAALFYLEQYIVRRYGKSPVSRELKQRANALIN